MPKSFREFKQFVEDKGKTPVVKQIADYPGPHQDKPPGGGAPYVAKGSKVKQGATGKGGKAIDGGKIASDWTSTGSKDLVYQPAGKTGVVAPSDYTLVPKKATKTKGFLTVKEFVEKTKDMSAREFAKYLAENNTNSGEVHDNIHQTVQILCENPQNTGDLVRELKRNGLLESTVAAALNHPEGYRTVARLMEDYEFCRKVVRSMDEMVGPPMHRHPMHAHPHADMGDEGMSGDPSAVPSMPPDMQGGMPGDPNEMSPDADPNDPDMGDDEPDEYDMGDEDDMLYPGSHPDDDTEFGLDDEDQDMGDDMGMGGTPNPNPMGAPDTPHMKHHRHRQPGMNPGSPPMPDQPAPSMMAKLMRRESTSPAASNLLRALRG